MGKDSVFFKGLAMAMLQGEYLQHKLDLCFVFLLLGVGDVTKVGGADLSGLGSECDQGV